MDSANHQTDPYFIPDALLPLFLMWELNWRFVGSPTENDTTTMVAALVPACQCLIIASSVPLSRRQFVKEFNAVACPDEWSQSIIDTVSQCP